MREGYKMTEVGEIPKDWEVVKLKDIGKAIIGLTYSPDDVVKKGGSLVFRSSNIRGNRIDYKDKVLVNKVIPQHLKTKEGDILICARNGSKSLIGKNALIDQTSANHSFGAFMSVYRTDNPKFIFQLFQTDFYRTQIDSNLGATINQITTGNLGLFKFPFPPKCEQNKIAEILTTVDDKIDIINTQIIQTQELKKGLIQQLLTRGIGHTKFKDSVLGEIPESWEVVNVKDITIHHKQGFYTKDGYTNDGTRLVRITDLKNPFVDFSNMPHLNISKKDYLDFKIEVGDFLFARSGAIGTYGIVENLEYPAVFASYLINFKFNSQKVLTKFFGYCYESQICKSQLKSIAQGNANININAENIKSLKLVLPPLLEQQKITNILNSINEKEQVLVLKKDALTLLKKGLMQQLLTGKIRVK